MHPPPTPQNEGLQIANWRPQIEPAGVVVEQPDHHCGDDLVLFATQCANTRDNVWYKNRQQESLI